MVPFLSERRPSAAVLYQRRTDDDGIDMVVKKPGSGAMPAAVVRSSDSDVPLPDDPGPGPAEAAPDIVGRALEIAAVERFLAALSTGDGGATALLIEGEAGVGKSLLWRSAIGIARARSMDVLECAPAAVEQALSFVALRDLLEDLSSESMERLPQPQRAALGAALLRSGADEAMDQGALGVALTAVLRARTEVGVTIVAIDDAQWLDAPTARTLAFAVRRLGAARVGFLLTRRLGEDASLYEDVESALAGRTQRIRLGPIGFGALHRLLSVRTGHRFARPVVARIERASGGNPMTALEIARALLESGTADLGPDEEFPVPERLRDLLNARLARLSPAGQTALQFAAALSHPTVDLVMAADDDPAAARRGLLEAELAGIVTIDATGLRFSHPLFASAVQAAAPVGVRRSVHQRLGAVAAGDEERALHLALATTDPDAEVADLLEAAAVQTIHRGAPDVGAGLLARAGALTPVSDVEARSRRGILEAEALLEAGDLARSASVLEGSLDRIPPGRQRAEALLLLGTVESYADRHRAIRTLDRALAEPSLDPTLRGRIHSRLALFEDDAQLSRAHARTAVALIDPAIAPSTLAFAMFGCFYSEVVAGLPADLSMFDTALETEPATPSWEVSTIPALWWKYTDQPDLARTRLDRHLRWARETGDESSDADLFAHLAELELYAGRWSRADEAAARSMEAAEQTGQAMPNPSHRVRALVDTYLGRLDVAIPAAAAGVAACRDTDPELEAMYLDVLGTAQSRQGTMVRRRAHSTGCGCSSTRSGSGSRCGTGRSQITSKRSSAWVHPTGQRSCWVSWSSAMSVCLGPGSRSRCHDSGRWPGRLTATSAAEPSSWRRVSGTRTVASPTGAAARVRCRAWLARPRRARASARSSPDGGQRLDQAVAMFDALPAPVWAARARQRIDRLGRHRDAGERLTLAEARVVALSARGLTNRAVADQLVLSPKTGRGPSCPSVRQARGPLRAELGRRTLRWARTRGGGTTLPCRESPDAATAASPASCRTWHPKHRLTLPSNAHLPRRADPGRFHRDDGSSESTAAQRAATQLSSEGRSVTLLGCLLVPSDDTVFSLFGAASSADVAAVGERTPRRTTASPRGSP